MKKKIVSIIVILILITGALIFQSCSGSNPKGFSKDAENPLTGKNLESEELEFVNISGIGDIAFFTYSLTNYYIRGSLYLAENDEHIVSFFRIPNKSGSIDYSYMHFYLHENYLYYYAKISVAIYESCDACYQFCEGGPSYYSYKYQAVRLNLNNYTNEEITDEDFFQAIK